MTESEARSFQQECAAFFRNLWPAEEKRLVFGEGAMDAPPLMLIGEAPGEQEALLGRPFVGKAGRNLDGFLDALRMRREDIWISNVVKIRPSKISAAGRVVNRAPTREEILLFLPWLRREIALVRPMALVSLGNVALRALAPEDVAIGQAHGAWRQAVVAPPDGAALTLPLFPLYHPASVIYRRELLPVYERDLAALAASLRASGDN